MNLKNKILLTAIVLLLSICIFNTDCFASFSVNYNDNIITLPDLPDTDFKYYVVVRGSDNGSIQLVCFDEDVYFEFYGIGAYLNTRSGDVVPFHTFSISVEDDSMLDYSSYSWTDHGIQNKSAVGSTAFKNIIYSNFDIYDIDDNLVFQKPVEEQLILTPVIQKQETTLSGVLNQIVRILPIVMIVVVSYLALRKALKMLLTFLRNS